MVSGAGDGVEAGSGHTAASGSLCKQTRGQAPKSRWDGGISVHPSAPFLLPVREQC